MTPKGEKYKMSKWIVEGLIPRGHIVLVAGQPGNGKSWWMAQLAVDAARGGKHMGEFDVEQCNVIYIDEDTPTDVYEERLRRIAFREPLSQLPIDQRSMSGFRLFQDIQHKTLIADIRRLHAQSKKPVLLIIDCLVKVMAGKNLDTVAGASSVMNFLSELRDAGATVVVVHHTSLKKTVNLDTTNLMGLVLNSTVLVSSSDTAFIICKAPIPEKIVFLISPESRRVLLNFNEVFAIELIEDAKKNIAALIPFDEVPVAPGDDARQLFQFFPDDNTKLTVKQIYEKLQEDLPRNNIRRGLAELVKRNCLQKSVDPHARSHAVWYQRHPNFDKLSTFYRKELLAINI